ncbi:MAG: hypothetical protein SVR04_05320 [Spirochaetota bacterium]|nr:hypothetical protein [Spirochaetota bacterium]
MSDVGDVYIAGYYENEGQKACYWKNDGNPVELEGVSDAVAYTVSGDGSEIFIGGQYNSAVAEHWKVGGGKIDLSSGSGDVVRSVAVSGTTVYAAGRYKDGSGNNKAAYWTDEDGDGASVLTTLDGGSNDVANSIWITDIGDVYAAGSYNSGGNIASYWKNCGSSIDIESGLGLAATGIQVAGTDIYTSGYYNDGSRQVACYWKNDTHFNLAKDSVNDYSSFATNIFLVELSD